MPYKKISQLPKPIQTHLPVHAQEIYKDAFNNAYKQYKERPDREETCHKVAWHAVKQKYAKGEDGNWHSL